MIQFPAMLVAAFAAGLLGSVHCLGMCAGISGLFAAEQQLATIRRHLPGAVVYNLGRVLSYALLGAVVAIFGTALVAAMPAIAGPVRIAAGGVIVLIGLQIAVNLRALRIIETTGARIWRLIAPAAGALIPVTSLGRAFTLGMLWGFLPCGLVYGALLVAATSADPVRGATVMVAFGAGTLPSMLLTGLGASRLSSLLRTRGVRVGAGAMLIAAGLLTMALPLGSLFSPAGGEHDHGSNGGTNGVSYAYVVAQ